MKKFLLIILFFIGIGCTNGSNFHDIVQKGFIEENKDLKIVHLYGNGYEVGYQQGKLLKTEIKAFYLEIFEKAFFPVLNANKQMIVDYFGYDDDRYKNNFAYEILKDSSKKLEESIPKEFIEEMHGISEGADIDYDKILLMNTYMDSINAFLMLGNFFQGMEAPHIKQIIFPANVTKDGIDNNENGIIDESYENILTYSTSYYAIFKGIKQGDIQIIIQDNDGVDPIRTKIYLNGKLCDTCGTSIVSEKEISVSINEYKFSNDKLFIEIDTGDKSESDNPPPTHTNSMRRERVLILSNNNISLKTEPNGDIDIVNDKNGVSNIFSVNSPKNETIIGRNFSNFDLNIAHLYSYLFVYHSRKGNSYISLSWPGIIGSVTGINSRGLFIGNNLVETLDNSILDAISNEFKLFLTGIPAPMLSKYILENYSHTEKAEKYLKKENLPSGWNFLIADKYGDKSAIEEDFGFDKGRYFSYSPDKRTDFCNSLTSFTKDNLWITSIYSKNIIDISTEFLGGVFSVPQQKDWAFTFFNGLNTTYYLNKELNKKQLYDTNTVIEILKNRAMYSKNNTLHSAVINLNTMRGYISQNSANAPLGDYIYVDLKKLFETK